MIGAANLFSRSKAPSRIEQFVSKRDFHLTIRTLGSKRDHQSVSFPPKAGHGPGSLLSANDFATI